MTDSTYPGSEYDGAFDLPPVSREAYIASRSDLSPVRTYGTVLSDSERDDQLDNFGLLHTVIASGPRRPVTSDDVARYDVSEAAIGFPGRFVVIEVR